MALDAATKNAYDQVYGAMIAMRDGGETAPAGGREAGPHWLVEQVKALGVKLDELAARPPTAPTDEQIQQQADLIAVALAAAPDVPLGDDDKPVIVEALKQALREGVGGP